MKTSHYTLGALLLMLGVLIGFSVSAAVESTKPAYVIVSGTVIDAEGLGPYREAAGPVARDAGIEVVARGDVLVLEGEWTHTQTLTVEKFSSMEALKSFWYSPEYQQAKRLRDGKFEADFIIAVEGL